MTPDLRTTRFRRRPTALVASLALGAGVLVPAASAGAAAVLGPATDDRLMAAMQLVTVAVDGGPANGPSDWADLSGNGDRVVLASAASNLVSDDRRHHTDIFLRELSTGTTTLISHGRGGGPANGDSHVPRTSRNGRFMVFGSDASNLVTGDTNDVRDVFLYDYRTGRTEMISVSSDEEIANHSSGRTAVSADGRYVVFESGASNLAENDDGTSADIFLRDRREGTTTLISRARSGTSGNSDSNFPVISADGNWAAYGSRATDLVDNDENGTLSDIFLYELSTGETTLITRNSNGQQSNGFSFLPQISDDGSRVAYQSDATNLAGPSNGNEQVYTYDALTGETLMASRSPSGAPGNGSSEFGIAVSGDGSRVAYTSTSSNLVERDFNGSYDVFVFDPETQDVQLVSRALDGRSADDWSDYPAMDTSGRFVSFSSSATDLVDEPEFAGYDILRRRMPR